MWAGCDNRFMATSIQKNPRSQPKPPVPPPAEKKAEHPAAKKPAEKPAVEKGATAPQVQDSKEQKKVTPEPAKAQARNEDKFEAAGKANASGKGGVAEPQAGQQAAQASAAQASKDADELYKATKGGLTGWGTDEKKVFDTLRGKSKEEVASIEKDFKDHYNRDLKQTLRDDLKDNSTDLKRINHILDGNHPAADAAAIRREQEKGLLGSNEEIIKTLQSTPPEKRRELAEAYQKDFGQERIGRGPDYQITKNGDPSQALQKSLSHRLNESEQAQVRELLAAGETKDPAERNRLEASVVSRQVGDTKDTNKVVETLGRLSPEQRAAVQQDGGVERTLNERLEKKQISSGDYHRALGTLKGDQSMAQAGELQNAMKGTLGPDQTKVRKLLEGNTGEQNAKVAEQYQQQTGRSLHEDIGRWGDKEQAQAAQAALQKPRSPQEAAASEARKLHLATRGWGTDEDGIRDTLKGKSKQEINQIADEYKKQYGQDLGKKLDQELSGREQVELYDQLYQKGDVDEKAPDAAQQKLERLRERGEAEKSWGTGLVNTIQRTTKGEADADRLERNLDKAQVAVNRGDAAEANKRLGYGQTDLQQVKESKDQAGEVAATVATTAAVTGAVVLSGGAATPLAVAGYAAIGAGTRYTAQKFVQGDALSNEEGLRQTALGALDGATAVLPVLPKGAGTAGNVGRQVVSEAAEQTALQRIRQEAVKGAGEGLYGAAITGAADKATQRETWENGALQGTLSVLNSAAFNGSVGALTGSVTGGSLQAAQEALSARRLGSLSKATPSGSPEADLQRSRIEQALSQGQSTRELNSPQARKLSAVPTTGNQAQRTQIQEVYYAPPGARLKPTLEAAAKRAETSQHTQMVSFNGEQVYINPGESAEQALKQYEATGKPSRVPYKTGATQIQEVYHAPEGAQLKPTVRDAVYRAATERKTQVVVFNGETLQINPGDTAKQALEQYAATGKPNHVLPKPGDRDFHDIGALSNIDNLSQALSDTARRTKRIQVADVNGLTLEVKPGDTAKSVREQYLRGAAAMTPKTAQPPLALPEARYRQPDTSDLGDMVERATRIANKSNQPFTIRHPGLNQSFTIEPGSTAPYNARKVAIEINSRPYPTDLGYQTPGYFGYHDYAVGLDGKSKLAIDSVSENSGDFVPMLSHYYKGYFSPEEAGGLPLKPSDPGPWRGSPPKVEHIPLANGSAVLRDAEGSLRNPDITNIQETSVAPIGAEIEPTVEKAIARANATRQTQNVFFNGENVQINPGAHKEDVLRRYAATGKPNHVPRPTGPTQIQEGFNAPLGANIHDMLKQAAERVESSGRTQLVYFNDEILKLNPGDDVKGVLDKYLATGKPTVVSHKPGPSQIQEGFNAPIGSNIKDLLDEANERVQASGRTQLIYINDEIVKLNPGDDVKGVLDKYLATGKPAVSSHRPGPSQIQETYNPPPGSDINHLTQELHERAQATGKTQIIFLQDKRIQIDPGDKLEDVLKKHGLEGTR
jgi:hypothetical protein